AHTAGAPARWRRWRTCSWAESRRADAWRSRFIEGKGGACERQSAAAGRRREAFGRGICVMTMSVSASDRTPVSSRELEAFTRQLGTLLAGGVEILRALDVAARQSGNSHLVTVTHWVAEALS